MNKKQALAKYLNVDESKFTEDGKGSASEYGIFEVGKEEWLVLTEEQANKAVKENILDSVWAFSNEFIIAHSSVLDYDDASNTIIKAIANQYEDGNEAMKKLIDDLDEFVEDAIDADGRGHYLSGYDGGEIELAEGSNIVYYAYRTS